MPRPKGNGQHGPPIVGGVDLSGLKPGALPPPRTQHKTVFQSCKLVTEVQLDEDNIVQGYVIKIVDILENHVYEFQFDQRTKSLIGAEITSWPDVGFPFKRDSDAH